MVAAASAQARLVGFDVQRHAVGTPEDYPSVLQADVEEGRRIIHARLAERVGSKKATRALFLRGTD
jgi:hypothetical protein